MSGEARSAVGNTRITRTQPPWVVNVPPWAAFFSILEDFRPGLRTTGITEASADAAEREAHPASIFRSQKMGRTKSKPNMMEVMLWRLG